MTLPPRAHRRYNPLLDEWVLVSPGRLDRPWQGRSEPLPRADSPEHDPECYLCPGNARANGERNPAYTGAFVFDNDFPALTDDGTGDVRDPTPALGTDEILRSVRERGVCRVVSFSPRHDLSLAGMTPDAVTGVIDMWAHETQNLLARHNIAHVQVFENKGEMMGCSNPHPHSQIWATQHVPTIPTRKLVALSHYYGRHNRDLLGDYIERELHAEDRVIYAAGSWIGVVPYWAVWPFEVLLMPTRSVGDLPSLDPRERAELAEALQTVASRYNRLFECEFPYSMGIAQAPSDGMQHPEWRLHVSFLPPLLRSATVRKHYVGYELLAEAQRDLTPETAAERLRALSSSDYRGPKW